MAFLAETVKTGTKNHYVIEAMHVLQRKLKKNLEIFWNVSVHKFYRMKEFITLEEVNTTQWSQKK